MKHTPSLVIRGTQLTGSLCLLLDGGYQVPVLISFLHWRYRRHFNRFTDFCYAEPGCGVDILGRRERSAPIHRFLGVVDRHTHCSTGSTFSFPPLLAVLDQV